MSILIVASLFVLIALLGLVAGLVLFALSFYRGEEPTIAEQKKQAWR